MPGVLKVVGGERPKAMYQTGDTDLGIIPCGQGIGLARDIAEGKGLVRRNHRRSSSKLLGAWLRTSASESAVGTLVLPLVPEFLLVV